MRDALLHLHGTTVLGATFEPRSGQILTLPGGAAGSAPEWSLFSPGWPTSVIIRASGAQGQHLLALRVKGDPRHPSALRVGRGMPPSARGN